MYMYFPTPPSPPKTHMLICCQIQLVNNLNDLDSMTNSLTEAMNQAVGSTSFSLPFDAIHPGLVCCAFSDEQWFRVLVLESPPSSSSFDVSLNCNVKWSWLYIIMYLISYDIYKLVGWLYVHMQESSSDSMLYYSARASDLICNVSLQAVVSI